MGKSLFESLTSDVNIRHHSDWLIFNSRLQSAIKSGHARRIQSTRTVYARSEEWYLDPANGDIYVYLRPDDKVLPEWTKVDVFAKPTLRENDPKNITTSGLGAIPRGKLDKARGESLKFLLERMVEQGEVCVMSRSTKGPPTKEEAIESTFQDLMTGFSYRLVEFPGSSLFLWDQI